jgi:hypothetical protein
MLCCHYQRTHVPCRDPDYLADKTDEKNDFMFHQFAWRCARDPSFIGELEHLGEARVSELFDKILRCQRLIVKEPQIMWEKAQHRRECQSNYFEWFSYWDSMTEVQLQDICEADEWYMQFYNEFLVCKVIEQEEGAGEEKTEGEENYD